MLQSGIVQVGLGSSLVILALTGCAHSTSGSLAASTPALAPSAAPSSTLSPADIAAHSTPAIVTVRAGNSLGTGFVVRPDGWVATNFHVVRGATQISVVFSDHRELPVVEVMNANRLHDLVILRVEAHGLPVLAVGDSDAVRPGDSVLAIGHPLGLEDTVSNGLISAVRHVHPGLDVLQVSAPIAPGSSGGPLFNDHGQVIGVATAILRGGQNLNFGLPSKYVNELVDNPHPIPMALFSAAMAAIQNQNLAASQREPARHVPHLELSALNGCSDTDKRLIVKTLAEAIDVGAPLYNEGKLAACYQIYEGAAADLSQRLPLACRGPKQALSDGRQRAAKLQDPSDQAWAMRDSFDGVLDLLQRASAPQQ
jgi:hypothetical protein